MDEVVNNGDLDVLSELLADNFVHHSERGDIGEDSVAGWLKAMGGRVPHTIKRVIGSSDLVLTHSHVTHPDMTTATFDIFRFDDAGKIAEHWSASQPIAEETNNSHPHF